MSRVVLVTGSSSGIGAATARLLAERGWTVHGGSPDGTGDEHLDVRSDESVSKFVERALGKSGRIDAVVNNAGIAIGGAIEEATIEEGRGILETNFFGMARMVRAVLPHFRAKHEGRIVNVSSGAGFTAEPFAGYYTASKFAIEGYSETLQHELRGMGIHVSLVQPGWFRTPIIRHAKFPATGIPDYAERRARVLDAVTKYCDEGPDPVRVARTIAKVLDARKPRLRYRVGKDVTMSFWSRRFLPEGFYLGLVADYYKITPR